MLLTAPIRWGLLLSLIVAHEAPRCSLALAVLLNHYLFMRQLLNRTLVLSPDSLKTMLHPISLLVASASVVIAALMTVDDASARTGLGLTVLEEARRHATGRLTSHIVVSWRLKDMVVSFPEIRTRGLMGTGLARALLRCRLGRAPTDNVRRRRRRRSIFVHDE